MLPSASVSFRQLPRTSAGIRGMFGRKMADGSFGIMRKTETNPINGRN